MTSTPPTDPMAMFRQFVTQWENMANEMGGKVAQSSEFTKGMQAATTASLQVQNAVNEGMSKVLATANLPSRAEIVALGERLGGVEDQLRRIESMLAGQQSASTSTTPKPRRTKTPPAPKAK